MVKPWCHTRRSKHFISFLIFGQFLRIICNWVCIWYAVCKPVNRVEAPRWLSAVPWPRGVFTYRPHHNTLYGTSPIAAETQQPTLVDSVRCFWRVLSLVVVSWSFLSWTIKTTLQLQSHWWWRAWWVQERFTWSTRVHQSSPTQSKKRFSLILFS